MRIVAALGGNALLRRGEPMTAGDGFFVNLGTPDQHMVSDGTIDELEGLELPAGSMSSQVQAACEFTHVTGGHAVIRGLDDVDKLVEGTAGTQVRA